MRGSGSLRKGMTPLWRTAFKRVIQENVQDALA
jgi:hypothetical protein